MLPSIINWQATIVAREKYSAGQKHTDQSTRQLSWRNENASFRCQRGRHARGNYLISREKHEDATEWRVALTGMIANPKDVLVTDLLLNVPNLKAPKGPEPNSVVCTGGIQTLINSSILQYTRAYTS